MFCYKKVVNTERGQQNLQFSLSKSITCFLIFNFYKVRRGENRYDVYVGNFLDICVKKFENRSKL